MCQHVGGLLFLTKLASTGGYQTFCRNIRHVCISKMKYASNAGDGQMSSTEEKVSSESMTIIVCFVCLFVCLFVCWLVGWLVGWLVCPLFALFVLFACLFAF